MSVPFRFIHASDLHLDRPLRRTELRCPNNAGCVANAPYRAAERMFDAASNT